MTLRETQSQIKRRFRKEIQELRFSIYGKCYDCTGFQADGYEDCEMKDCSLYPYRLKQPVGRTSRSLASHLREIKCQIQQKNDDEVVK